MSKAPLPSLPSQRLAPRSDEALVITKLLTRICEEIVLLHDILEECCDIPTFC